MELAARFRDLRVQAGLTKTALAGPRYTVSYVSQIEAGRRMPSAQAVAYFAEQLGVSERYLATGVPEGIEDELRYRLEEARTELRDGHGRKAESLARSVVARAQECDLPALAGEGRLLAAEALARQERWPRVIAAYTDVLGPDGPKLSTRQAAGAVAGLARAYHMVGDLGFAARVVEAFLERAGVEPLDPASTAELQSVLVSIHFERGEVVRAERAARLALRAAAATGSLDLKARTYWSASKVLAELGRWREALEFAHRARTLMEEVGDRESVARLHAAYAFICLEARPPRPEEAGQHLDQAEALLSTEIAMDEVAPIQEQRGRIALLLERPDEALGWASKALSMAGPASPGAARALLLKGRSLVALARKPEAGEALREAAELFGELGDRQHEAACWREVGELGLAEGDVAGAAEALRAGLLALDPHRSRA